MLLSLDWPLICIRLSVGSNGSTYMPDGFYAGGSWIQEHWLHVLPRDHERSRGGLVS